MFKINWRKGSGEALSFAICIPMLTIVAIALLSTAQISVLKQSIEYVTYSATRAASLSATFDRAEKRAETIVSTYIYGDADHDIEPSIQVAGMREYNGTKDQLNSDTVQIDIYNSAGDHVAGPYPKTAVYVMEKNWKHNYFIVLTTNIRFKTVCPFFPAMRTTTSEQIAVIENTNARNEVLE